MKEPSHRAPGLDVAPYSKVVNLQDISLDYLDIGQGPVVLFLHGALTNGENWRRLLPFLYQHFRCIVPTLPLGAHRHAAKPGADLSVKGVADIVAQFIRKLNLGPMHLIANDTGGVYAQMLIAEASDLIKSLLLSNCDAFDLFPPRAFASLPKAVLIPGYVKVMSWLFTIPAFVKSPMALGLLSNSLSAKELQHPLKVFVKESDVRRDFRAVASSWKSQITRSLANKLSDYKRPVQIIWGEEDELFPISLGRELASAFDKASFIAVPGAKTYVHCDQPAIFANYIRTFIMKQ